jgi:helicase
MPETQFNILVSHLSTILDKKSKDIVEVLRILDTQEKNELLLKFNLIDKTDHFDISKLSDIRVKADAISSLIPVLLNNPILKSSIEKIQNNGDNRTRDLLKELYQIGYDLNKTSFYTGNYEDENERLSVLVISSINAILADKVTEADFLINENINDFILKRTEISKDVQKLVYNTYLLILFLLRKVRDQEEKKFAEDTLEECEQLLVKIQGVESSTDEINDGFLIGGLANLIYILKSVKTYLYTGKAETEDNIYSMLETYCYNAVKLLENTDQEKLTKVANILKYGLEQICRNSIWEITNKSPLIKRFFENAIKSKDNLILSLFPSQRDSILDILSTKKSILLNMPTSSGKSLLAELYILFTIQNYTTPDSKPTICYLVPTNALINQVKHRFAKQFEEFNYRIETVLPFYDVDEIEENILNSEHIDILISTPEKLDFLIRKDHPSLKDLKLVVLDEAHNLSDPDRGPKFELLLATIKQRRRDINYLLLSPFISNYKEIAEWLGETEKDSVSINMQWSPTKQFIGCNVLNKERTTSTVVYFPSATNNIINEPVEIDLKVNPREFQRQIAEPKLDHKVRNLILMEKYLMMGGATLILCEGPGSAESLAKKAYNYFSASNKLKDISQHPDIKEAITLIKFELSDDNILINCLKYGIAFHHSRLSTLIKEEIEKLVSNRHIKILCATTTLAQGMNFPITTVIFDKVTLGPRDHQRLLTGAEFWNIAGRAGRAYMDSEGHIIIAFQKNKEETEKTTKHYIEHNTKEIISSLNNFFQTISESVEFDYKLIKDNPAASSFLQYLNHILRVTYQYNFESIDTSKIRNILNSSLFYKELTFKEGFIESQERISDFSFKYVNYLKGQNKGKLTLADLFGISNISLNRVSGVFEKFKNEIEKLHGELQDDYINATKIILDSKDNTKLAEIIKIIHQIPEMKLEIFERGNFNPESVATIIIGWVNGRNILDIANAIKYPNEHTEEVLGKCQQYVNGTLKSYVPWGVSIYQQLTNDDKTERSKILPSFIYYGVNDVESVILSKLGIPRFAVKRVKELYKQRNPELPITIDNMPLIKRSIKTINADEYDFAGADKIIVKQIIENNL